MESCEVCGEPAETMIEKSYWDDEEKEYAPAVVLYFCHGHSPKIHDHNTVVGS